MQSPEVWDTRQQTMAILLKLLAIGFGLCTIPLVGEGVESLFQNGHLLWPFECFAMATVPAAISYGLWRRRQWARAAALWICVLAIPLLPLLIFALAILSYSNGFVVMVLALLLSLFAALIAGFLTSAGIRALFGMSQEQTHQQHP